MPDARFSNSEAMMATLCFLASVKFALSSLWQKYCERKSSCVQIIFAPDLAARSMSAMVFFRFASGFAETEVWISPSLTSVDSGAFMRSTHLLVQPRRFFEEDGFELRIRRQRLGRFLAEQFADELAERLVGRAVAGAVDVEFQVIHQLVGGGVTAVRVMHEAVVENVVQLVVNARIKNAEIGNRLVEDAVARFLGGRALENISSEQQMREHDTGGKNVRAFVGDLKIRLLGTHVIGLAGDDFAFLVGEKTLGLGDAEIRQLHVALEGDHDVFET